MPVDIDVSADWQIYLFNEVLAPVRQYLYDRLTVREWVDQTYGSETHYEMPDECAGFRIPDRMKYYQNSGQAVNIFVFGYEADCSEGSWGAPCAVDADNLDEPVYGAIWINTQLLTTSSHADNFHNMLRQTFHVLAFHNLLYPLWRNQYSDRWFDNQSEYYTDWWSTYANPITTTSENGRTVYHLSTPDFLTHLRGTTSCNTLTGLPLEETCDDAIAGVNFDKKYAGNEIMTNGYDSEPTVVSGLTWNALEDSGWYRVDYIDYTTTDDDPEENELAWLVDVGCTFFSQECVVNYNANFPQFCTDAAYTPKCNYDMTHRGVCGYANYYPTIPDDHQYFQGSTHGGHDPQADYCPYVVSVEGGDCRNPDLDSYARSSYGEAYGPSSRCIEGTLAPSGYLATCNFSGCFNVACDNDNSKVVVTIGEVEVDCLFSEAGDQKTVTGMEGHFLCPDGALMCNADISNCVGSCFGHGVCTGPGGCVCHPGYSGHDCRTKCDVSCYTCIGSGSSQCTSCWDDATLSDTTSGSCSCGTGEVFDEVNQTCDTGCGVGSTLVDGVCTNVHHTPYIGWSANSGSYSEFGHGYDANELQLCVDETEPPYILDQGAFFNSECHIMSICDTSTGGSVVTYAPWTFEAWIRPYKYQRVIASARFTSNFYDDHRQDMMEIFLTKCQGLGVNWHWDQFSTPAALIPANQWSHIAVIVKKIDHVMGIELWVNGVHRGGGLSFREWDLQTDDNDSNDGWIIGADQFREEHYVGWIYSWRLWSHALEAEDLDFMTECDKNMADCDHCPCRDEAECLEDCDWDWYLNTSPDDDRRDSSSFLLDVAVCTECDCSSSDNRGCDSGSCHTCSGDYIGSGTGSGTSSTCTCDYSTNSQSTSDTNCGCGNYAGFTEQCTLAATGYELHERIWGNHNSTDATACTGNVDEGCTYPRRYHLLDDNCRCHNGQYYDEDIKKCKDCPAGCKTCTSSNIWNCGECEEGYYELHKAGACVKDCPTGSSIKNGRCDQPHDMEATCPTSTALGTEALYQITKIWNDFYVDMIDKDEEQYIVAGYQAGQGEIDDPIIMEGRGLWFDGIHMHLTFGNTTLSHTYGIHFMMKNYLQYGQEGAIYSAYHEPDERQVEHTSMFSYSLLFDTIVFRDQVGDLLYKSPCSIATFKIWTVVSITAEWIQCQEQTKLTFSQNRSEKDTAYVPKLLVDSGEHLHFFGGIRHHMQLVTPFRGFLQAVEINNFSANEPASWYDVQHCNWNQVCLYANGEATYPSECEPYSFQYSEGNCYMCHIACRGGCVRLEDCDLCHEDCDGACTGFGADECVVAP